VLGHRISAKGIKVDKVKIDEIDELPPPMTKRVLRVSLDI
jgi:hypothetical protein